jgi:hypothetical protein
MSNLSKPVVGLLGFVVIGAVAFVISSRANPFSSSLPIIHGESQQLDSALEDANRRIEIGESLGQAVAEGRKSLVDAAGVFLAAHVSQPGFLETNALHYPDRSPLEFAARNIAIRAFKHAHDPEKREQLAKTLNEQFNANFPQAEPLNLEVFPPAPGPELVPPPNHQPPVPFPPPLPPRPSALPLPGVPPGTPLPRPE